MKLYKFRSLKNLHYVLDIILLERLHCAPYFELNDPCEGLFFEAGYIGLFNKSSFICFYKPDIKTVRTLIDTGTNVSNLKICSLSKTLSDIRLWSYYADSHRGVAIEMDFSGKEEVKKVNYFPNLLEHTVRPSLLGDASKPEDVLYNKTKHWKYEKEYRIIQDSEYYSVSGRVTSVYAGINSKIYYDLLKKVVPPSIKLFQTKLNPHNLKIEVDRIITR